MFINNTLFFYFYRHTPGAISKLFAVHEMCYCLVTDIKLYRYYWKEHFNLPFLHLALLQYMLEYFSQFNEMWPLHPILKYVSCTAYLALGHLLMLNIGVDFTLTRISPFGIFDFYLIRWTAESTFWQMSWSCKEAKCKTKRDLATHRL